ncbi:MAG: glycosyltransferase [Pseudomonadota bacterium]|nr:glycosyltransferase [Pseudomonadota bacterium]
MRILTLTTLYPNAAAPAHGIFVENRLKDFAARSGAEIRVVAPVPWFPVSAPQAGKYAAYAAAPAREIRHGLEVRHPRYLIPPRIGMTYAATALTRCFLKSARALLDEGWDFDLIDAHYLYPDGVAAVRAAKTLGKPVALTTRGTDVSLLPQFPRQKRMILDAVIRADAVVAVAQALKDELVGLGAPAEKIRVLRNGVDLEMFRPLDRAAIRARMGLSGPVIASVGHLIERKGHHLVIEALKGLPDATLLIAGDGEERAHLEALAAAPEVAGRIRFLGAVPHGELAEIYNAADVLALASSREGWPNVLLEAMACGTPAVATPVWGNGEVVAAPEAGLLAESRTAPAMAAALESVLAAPPERAATRLYAERFSWAETSDNLASLFSDMLERRRAASSVRTRPVQARRAARPRMIVTVDTEEMFDWDSFDQAPFAVAAPEGVDRFQIVCASFGARPLYFLTQPVIEDAASAAYFRYLQDRGAADLGLHLHQWTTPPYGAYDGEYYSWQCNLPAELQAEKLRQLGAAYERAFSRRARAHRAGRYGVDRGAYHAIAAAGIDLDFSPSAAFDFSKSGGPDFRAMGNWPFEVSTEHGNVFVTPVCGAHFIPGVNMALPKRAAPGFNDSRGGALHSLIEPLRLSPEGARHKELAAMTRRFVAEDTPVLTFSLHSTSLTPGATPYARDEAGVDALLDACKRYFEFFTKEIGGEFISLDELAALYGVNE